LCIFISRQGAKFQETKAISLSCNVEKKNAPGFGIRQSEFYKSSCVAITLYKCCRLNGGTSEEERCETELS